MSRLPYNTALSVFTPESATSGRLNDRFLIELTSSNLLRIELQTGSCNASVGFNNPYEYRR